jgi:hypothetical protein
MIKLFGDEDDIFFDCFLSGECPLLFLMGWQRQAEKRTY